MTNPNPATIEAYTLTQFIKIEIAPIVMYIDRTISKCVGNVFLNVISTLLLGYVFCWNNNETATTQRIVLIVELHTTQSINQSINNKHG